MNPAPESERSSLVYVAAIIGAFLIFAALVWEMRKYAQAPALNQERAAVRAKALAELRGEANQALNTVGWIDQSKGIVRLTIADTMNMVEREWQNPAAARSNLIARVEKANFIPPPPPNPFE
jgi:hypothetical protein